MFCSKRLCMVGLFLFVIWAGAARAEVLTVPMGAGAPVPGYLYVRRGAIVRFTGQLAKESSDIQIVVRNGARVCDSGRFIDAFAVNWDTSRETTTVCVITVAAIRPGGDEVRLARTTVELLDKTPFSFTVNGPETVQGTMSLRISGNTNVSADHFDLQIDGKPTKGPVAGDAQQTDLDVSGLAPGDHRLTVATTLSRGADKTPYLVPFVVPAKVALSMMSPRTLDISDLSPDVPLPTLNLRILPDADITGGAISVFLNSTPLTKFVASKEDARSYDLHGIEPGNYRVRAELLTSGGHKFLSPEATVMLTRDPARELKARQERERKLAAATELHRRQAAEAAAAKLVIDKLRAVFADRLASRPAERAGSIGRVRVIGIAPRAEEYPVTGEKYYVNETGKPFNLEVTLTPGSGRVLFSGRAVRAQAVAVARAAVAWCKIKLAAMDRPVNLKNMDVTFSTSDWDQPASLDAAGLAEAAAVMSAALKLPVDNAAVFFGSFDEEGKIQSVGGTSLLTEALFRSSGVRCIIVPADMAGANDADGLFDRLPWNFVNRRVVLINTPDDAFRQALIGYDKAFEEADRNYYAALTDITTGKDAEAVKLLDQVRTLTPENVTAARWYTLQTQVAAGRIPDGANENAIPTPDSKVAPAGPGEILPDFNK